ncbi:hypothetical protein [Microbacterium sp. NPDC055683]
MSFFADVDACAECAARLCAYAVGAAAVRGGVSVVGRMLRS